MTTTAEHGAEKGAGITYAKPALWDQGILVRARHLALAVRLAARCAMRGHEWRDERVTRVVRVTACRVCGKFIGSSIDRSNPEHSCLWSSTRATPPEGKQV